MLLTSRVGRRAARIAETLDRQIFRAVARRPFWVRPGACVVTFTFDDFAQSAAEKGAEILEREGVLGTFYASFGRLNAEEVYGPTVSLERLVDIHRRGHEIGCHTYNHIGAAELSRRDLAWELNQNRISAENIGAKLEHFAYPFGQISSHNKSVVAERYLSARTIGNGWPLARRIVRGQFDAMNLPAYALEREADFDLAKALIHDVAKGGGWLIFYSHDVTLTPSRWGLTPLQLKTMLRFAIDQGVSVLPVGRALSNVARGHVAEGAGTDPRKKQVWTNDVAH